MENFLEEKLIKAERKSSILKSFKVEEVLDRFPGFLDVKVTYKALLIYFKVSILNRFSLESCSCYQNLHSIKIVDRNNNLVLPNKFLHKKNFLNFFLNFFYVKKFFKFFLYFDSC